MVDTSADSAQEQRNTRFIDQQRRRIEAASEPGKQAAAGREGLLRAADRNQRGLLPCSCRRSFVPCSRLWGPASSFPAAQPRV